MMTLEPHKLLIVDDNPTNIKVLFDFLKNYGFKVLIAKNGENALTKLEEITPDLILLDIMMPGINGFETCERIKENPSNRDVPIIFMTALADTENKVKGLSLGAVDYITKPFQQEEVLARINLHLKLRSLTKELAEKNQQLSQMNELLEHKVEERTLELKKAQSQLIISEKMSSLGQLVAGIAHEINNPVGFISGNLQHIRQYTEDLMNLINLYQTNYPNPVPEIAEEITNIELDYLVEDLPQLIDSMQSGTKRIADISQSMRIFSRADSNNKIRFNIHEGIDSTLLILKYRLKANDKRPAIEVVKNYGNLPEIECYPSQLNQVFMNLIVNGIEALEELSTKENLAENKVRNRTININTEHIQNEQIVKIIIRDNGIGIEPAVQKKIFEYLFTTKAVGKGTGLGLSISRQIVEDNHQGSLTFNSVFGEGTEFIITLPLLSS
ncbi:response regulator [Floridanema evergladense]|uniref:histidine kinase n=1 Tax=Floridaenema evergladense BLCC-F167 TaxID=3153639 RepID=A0ABV4WQF5_9CYAN